MKKILGSIAFTVVAACLTSSMAMAATTCPTGQYSAYTGAGFSCATNNLTFSLFGFNPTASGGAAVPTAASVGVTPIDQLGNEGFTFNPGFNVSAGQSQDVAISFLVTAAPGTLIDDLSIGFNGSVTGNGTTVFSEKYCTGGFNTNCTIFTVFNPGSLDQHINITPTTQLWITKDFGATSNTGSASVSQVTNQYSNTSAVPEPASLSLMGLGLLGLGLIGRRRKA
jgi:hypothetical protein